MNERFTDILNGFFSKKIKIINLRYISLNRDHMRKILALDNNWNKQKIQTEIKFESFSSAVFVKNQLILMNSEHNFNYNAME